ncbi:MAG: hypothetical protein FWE84_01900 [Firmicutes bacterium]|nr:hypothetical protein [Bacillota bacterium]
MNEIYKLIGQIVEACQYIEGMFQSIIAFQPIIESDYDEEKETVNGMPLEIYMLEHKDEIARDFKKAYEMCLGNVTSKVFSMHDFPQNLVNAIMKVIKERNRIIHYFFKENDFYLHWNNEKFIRQQVAYLQKRVDKTRNVCDQLRLALGAELWADRWDKSVGSYKKSKK